MKDCAKLKKLVYYKGSFNERWVVKIRRTILMFLVIICFLTTSILTASAERRSISQTIHLTLRVLPNTDLNINEAKIDDELLSLDSESLLNAVSPNDGNVTVDKVVRNGEEMIRLTRVFEEVLY